MPPLKYNLCLRLRGPSLSRPPPSESTMANGGTVSLRLSRLIRVGGTQAAKQASTRQRRCPFCGHGQKNKTFHKLEVAYQNVICALYQLLPNNNRQRASKRKAAPEESNGENREADMSAWRRMGRTAATLAANRWFFSPSACWGIHLY